MKRQSHKLILIGLTIALVSIACGLSANLPTEEPTTVPAPTQGSVPTPVESQELPSVITDEDQVLIELYDRVNPAVVNIVTYVQRDGSLVPSGQGSGFVISSDGDIVTNAHVVFGAEDIDVIFSDNSIRRAEVIGEDLHSDLAVVKVDSLPSEIQPLSLGNIDDIAVGQTVVAIGNPFGLGGTLTRGIVSGIGRTIPALTPFSIPQAIQTDAPINPGNSGGPLLNLNGEVIGVNAQIENSGENRANSGVGFAIPVSIVDRVIPVLIERGEFKWAWFGVIGTTLNPTIVEAMDLPFENGAYLISIVEDGPSDQANLIGSNRQISVDGRTAEVGGDIITAIEGQPVNSFDDLLIYISLFAAPDQDVTVTVWRDGEYKDITVRLEERPQTESFFPQP